MKLSTPADQQFVNNYLDRAMLEFDRNRLAPQLMRRLAAEYPDEFVSSAMRYLDTNDESNAHRFLATLMLHLPAIFEQIADPALRSKPCAARLLKRFLAIDPTFDVRFARRLPDRTGANHSTAFDGVRSERALDVLDETSHGRRLFPIVGHLSTSSNSRISSRAVLFIGRRLMSAAWVEQQLRQQPDPRARANAVEGIWGLNSPVAKELLQMCTEDECNRVVGNALVGLNMAGRPGVAEELRKLSHRPEDPFRSTAAWAMGKLGDKAFLDSLRQLSRDDSPMVRSAALRAMIGVRRMEAEHTHTIDTAEVVAGIEAPFTSQSFATTRENIEQRP